MYKPTYFQVNFIGILFALISMESFPLFAFQYCCHIQQIVYIFLLKKKSLLKLVWSQIIKVNYENSVSSM